ncbi:hypothetical protein PO909_023574 [Leuciscus waleckii]
MRGTCTSIWQLNGTWHARRLGGPWGLAQRKSSHCNPLVSQIVNKIRGSAMRRTHNPVLKKSHDCSVNMVFDDNDGNTDTGVYELMGRAGTVCLKYRWEKSRQRSMKRTEKAESFRKCADPCPRYLTPGDTHELCVLCLGKEHAQAALEGAVCANCERFSLKTLRSRLALFSSEEGLPSVPRGSGSARVEAERRLASWSSQRDLADRLERGVNLSDDSADDEGELQVDDEEDFSPTIPATDALQDGQVMDEEEVIQVDPEPSQPPCPVYAELLDVMERATDRLQLPWRRVRGEVARGRLDDRFLPGRRPPAQASLPFLPDLHTEIERAWKNPYSARIHRHQRASFADVEGIGEYGYVSMPPIDESFANHLVSGRASTLSAPALPSRPLKTTARLNGRAYTAAGQAGAALHTMAVLQAYQADLLGDLDQGTGLSPEAVAELRRTTDLALRATKHTAASIGRIRWRQWWPRRGICG